MELAGFVLVYWHMILAGIAVFANRILAHLKTLVWTNKTVRYMLAEVCLVVEALWRYFWPAPVMISGLAMRLGYSES